MFFLFHKKERTGITFTRLPLRFNSNAAQFSVLPFVGRDADFRRRFVEERPRNLDGIYSVSVNAYKGIF